MLNDVLSMVRPKHPWRLHLHGYSMSPTMLEGDELLVVPQDEPARLGDVVVFPYREQLVAHRVIGAGEVLRTAGDASRGAVERIDPREVLGKVTEVRRRGRIIHSYASSPVKAVFLRARLALRYHLRLHR